jgi:hypothetical protein
VCVRSVKAPYSKSLASIGPTVPRAVPWSWWSRERAFDKYCLGTSAARCSTGKFFRLSGSLVRKER